MKYFERAGIYKASNVSFDPKTCEARSYAWWIFVRKIGNKVVFNNYRYSVTTAKHQSKVRWLLAELGINIDVEIEAPQGLQRSDIACSLSGRTGLSSAIQLYEDRIKTLEAEMKKPRTRKAKNYERFEQIKHYYRQIIQVKLLIQELERGSK